MSVCLGDVGNQFYMIAYGEMRVSHDQCLFYCRLAWRSSILLVSCFNCVLLSVACSQVTVKPKDGKRKKKEEVKGGAGTKSDESDTLPNKRQSTMQNSVVSEEEIELCRMGPGKYFGEIALVQNTPRTATVSTSAFCCSCLCWIADDVLLALQ